MVEPHVSASAGGGVQPCRSAMHRRLQLGSVNGARLEAGEVERDVPEPGRTDGVAPRLRSAVGRDRGDVVRADLDPCHLPVVTDAEVGEPEPRSAASAALDLGQLVRRDLLEVRDPRGQARRGRLVRATAAPGRGRCADGGLVEAGVRERAQDAVLAGRPRAGAIGTARVVGVLAVRDGVEPVRGDDLAPRCG